MSRQAPTVGRTRGQVTAVALGSMLAPLNSTMLAVALPQIVAEMNGDIRQASWLASFYMVATAVLHPVAGTLGDRFGRRALVLAGLGWFGAASALAAGAPSMGLLLVWRVHQAAAASLVLPNGMAILRHSLPPDRRASGFGLVNGAVALAVAGGPLLGGLSASVGWRITFLLNLVVIVPALLLAFRTLPHTPTAPPARFDVVGAVLLALLLTGGTVAISVLPGVASAIGWVATAGALALGLRLFLAYERRVPAPVIPLRLFAAPGFAAPLSAMALTSFAIYAVVLAVPLLAAGEGHSSGIATGARLSAFAVAMLLVTPVGGRLADRWGRRATTVTGLAVFTIGLVPLGIPASLGGGALGVLGLAGLCLAGGGLGFASAGMQTAALEAAGPTEAGVASGLYATARYLGGITGTSAVGGIGPHRALTVCIAFAALSVLAARRIARTRRPGPGGTTGRDPEPAGMA